MALKACRQALIDAGNCRRQVNQQTVRLRRLFKWAVAQELIPATVLTGLQTVSGLRLGHTKAPDREPVGPVCDEYVDAIKSYVGRPV